MDMQASRSLAITQQQAWEALNDPAILKACIPGCDKLESTGENQFVVGMALKIGPVSAKFSGKIQLADLNPPASYTLSFEGQGGVAGFGKGTASVTLVPIESGCELQYTVHAQVGGKIAQLGQRLIDGAAKSLAEDFFKRFDAAAAERFASGAAEADTGAAADAALADAAPAPGSSNAWMWGVGAAVLAAAVWILTR
ncbi:MAG: carbon monoxide dehydrogenase subunit G [Burkholderiaceae bacterium]|jgi:carbon monoxide dehydrogenase subunit G|nr:carbon monoxide dehydrogenase subunit G [Burkholderiaceae bacterium]